VILKGDPDSLAEELDVDGYATYIRDEVVEALRKALERARL